MAYSLYSKTDRLDRDDIFLNSQSLFRKKMPLDGNGLFRAVAEQMYDSQSLHFEVRKECVCFLTLKRRFFEKQIQGDFDKYTLRMSWPHTRGGMIEMRAMCLLYRRNLRIYEFNKPAVVVTYSKQFRQLFTIYYTSQHHFDLVYTNAYYKTAATAQAICYKLIFKQLLRMPDVELAVQHMLFPGTYKKSSVINFGDKLVFRNGHSFQLDKPQQTMCMLINEMQCSFHNGHSSVSCMRKLLHDHCVPFSNQVAKSLHPHFYRNVELDVYRATNLQVGDKCVVSIAKRFYDCYIQSIDLDTRSCFVYVVHWCQMVKVSLSTVRRSPRNEFQWMQKQQQPQTPNQHHQSPFNFDAISYNSEEKKLMSNCLGCVSWTQVVLFTKTKAQFSSRTHEPSMLPLRVHQQHHQ